MSKTSRWIVGAVALVALIVGALSLNSLVEDLDSSELMVIQSPTGELPSTRNLAGTGKASGRSPSTSAVPSSLSSMQRACPRARRFAPLVAWPFVSTTVARQRSAVPSRG